MGNTFLTQNPFGVLTFIVAPAILTNATSVLAMSTINRMLRTRDRMQELYTKSESCTAYCGDSFMTQVNRIERQSLHLLSALRWIYTGLGSFAAASLIALFGALAGEFGFVEFMRAVVAVGLLLGVVGVAGLIGGCLNLLQATQLSLVSIHDEATAIRKRQEKLES